MATLVTGMAFIAGLVVLVTSGLRAFGATEGPIRAAGLPATLPTTTFGRAGLAFIGRATGDFNPPGFLGTPDGSVSARLDTAYYSPLCLFLGMTAIVLAARGHW